MERRSSSRLWQQLACLRILWQEHEMSTRRKHWLMRRNLTSGMCITRWACRIWNPCSPPKLSSYLRTRAWCQLLNRRKQRLPLDVKAILPSWKTARNRWRGWVRDLTTRRRPQRPGPIHSRNRTCRALVTKMSRLRIAGRSWCPNWSYTS